MLLTGLLFLAAGLAAAGRAVEITRSREVGAVPVQSLPGTRLRLVGTLVIGAVTAAVTVQLHTGRPDLFGLPFLLAPAVGAIASLVSLAAWGPPRISDPAERSTALVPRHPWSFGPWWATAAPAAAAVSFLLFTVAAGLSSSQTDDGTWRGLTVTAADVTSTVSPYPGWFYGVPAIIVTVLLVGAALAALLRTSSAPLRGDPDQIRVDLTTRAVLARQIMLVTSGALLGYAGGVLFFAGDAVRSVSTGGEGGAPVHGGLMVLGVGEMILGAVFVIVSLAMGFRALDGALHPRTTSPVALR